LFLKRGGRGALPGTWAFPGGVVEDGETAEAAAIREAEEETGASPKISKGLTLLTRRLSVAETGAALPGATVAPAGEPPPSPPGTAAPAPLAVDPEVCDFSTFLVAVEKPFEVVLNDESDAFSWCPVDSPPEPLHPGCRIALDRPAMNELDVARAMATGELSSPQRYMNVSLFAIRITGTGAAYRRALDEYVWRKPEMYLNDEFVARCNGLQVIFEHPDGATLNSKEFAERSVGSIMLPYVMGDEVWGIAKIYDDEAIGVLLTDPMSTSPTVVLSPGSKTYKANDGSTILDESEPLLLDHVAICARGVWDKGGEPRGVTSATIGDSDMTEEEKAALAAKAKSDAEESRAKADAEAGEKLDKLLTHMDSFGKRMDTDAEERAELAKRMDAVCSRLDAIEGKKPDAEKTPEELAAEKKDADEAAEKEAQAKKDAEEEVKKEAKADSDIAAIKSAVADLAKRTPRSMTDADYSALADAQARADAVMSMHGVRAGRPMDGETVDAYRLRQAKALQVHSDSWKDVDLTKIADSTAFGIAEKAIFADAEAAALRPVNGPAGELRPVVRVDSETGRRTTEFYGRGTFVRQFKQPKRLIAATNLGRRDRG